MPELTPLDDNRQEHFLNGEDLEPITRREHFYAGRESELPEGHQEPETREEWFIQKYRGGGGDVTVVPLSVTENGTYSEEGKAYSPVNVNVPLPTNAYLLKSVANLPQAIASFNDGEEMVMPSLKVAIEPQQEGSGDPSPTNVRPIIGWDKVDLSVSGVNVWDEEWEVGTINSNGQPQIDTSKIRSKNFIEVKPNTNYYCKDGGNGSIFIYYYDANQDYINGNVVVTNNTITTPTNCNYVKFRTYNYGATYNNDISINYPSTDTDYHAYNGNTYTIDLDGTRYGGEVDVVNGIVTPAPYYASYNGEALTGEWISDRDKYEVGTTPTIGAQVVNIGASGTPVSILPTAIKSLRGVNNVYANTGDIKDAEYFSKEV